VKAQRIVYAVVLAAAFALAAPFAFAAAPEAHENGEHLGEVAEHAGGHHGPESINWFDVFDTKKPAFLALVINFGVLAALYYTLGKKPVAEGLKQRRIAIGKDIEDAQKYLAEAKERAKKYQGDLANADTDAETARAALIASGRGDADSIVKEASERSERMKRDAELLVEQERRQLHQDIHLETIDLAVEEASKVLAQSITPDDHSRFANDLLAELSRRPTAVARALSAPASTGGAS
jgi:F-type H+-transporting ATPase subunit b